MNRSTNKPVLSLLLASVMLAVGGGVGWLAAIKFRPPVSVVEDDHPEDDGGHGSDVVEMARTTMDNMDLSVGKFQLTDFHQKVTVPAEVVEMLPAGRRTITAPIAGRIARVLVSPRQSIEPGKPIFEIEVTDQELSEAQVELIEVLSQAEISQKRMDRLKPLVESGAVAGKRLLEIEFQLKGCGARERALRQKLTLRGMDKDQIQQLVDSGTLVQSVIVCAPELDAEEKASPVSTGPMIAAEEPAGEDLQIGTVSGSADKSNGESSDVKIKMEENPSNNFFTVESVDALEGSVLEPGDALCSLTHHGQLLIRGMAFESDVEQIANANENGWDFSAVFGESPATSIYEGLKLHSIDNHVEDGTQAYSVYVGLKNEVLSRRVDSQGRKYVHWKFKPGQRVHLEIPVQKWSESVVAPRDALVREGPETFVFKMIDHTHTSDDGTVIHEFIKTPVKVLREGQESVVLERRMPMDIHAEYALGQAYQLNLALKQAAGGGAGHGHSHDHPH